MMCANRYMDVKLELIEFRSRQQKFLEAIQNPDPDNLREILEEDDVHFNINQIYKHGKRLQEYNGFQILCSDIINLKEDEKTLDKFLKLKSRYIKCAELLLSHNIDITYRDPDYKAQAIDFAVLTGEIEVVHMVLNKHKESCISIANIDLISTIILFFDNEREVDEEYLNIIELLIDSGVDINTLDFDTGTPPIYLAASLRFKQVVQLMITRKMYDIDLDYYVDEKGKNARMLIKKYNLFDGSLPNKNANPHHLLYKYLKERNTIEFIEKYKLYRDEMSNEKKCSFLIRSVQLGVEEIVEYLLNKPENFYNDNVKLLELACGKGYFKVIEVLFDETPEIPYNIQTIQDIITIKTPENSSDYINYEKCLSILLCNNREINLNQKNKYGKTLLENAIKCKKFSMVSILLNNGASMIVLEEKDQQKCLVSEIHPKLIEKHFDDCISINEDMSKSQMKRKKTTKVDRKNDYTIDFSSILPPHQPIIQATLENKNVKEFLPEMTAFKCIATNPDYNTLLNHPLATIFISLKWFRIRNFFFADILLYTIYTIMLNTYIFVPNIYVYLLLLFIFSLVQFWEVFQLVIFRFKYFTYYHNWLKFIFSLVTLSMLGAHYFKNDNDIAKSVVTQIHATGSLVSIINFFVLIGQFPNLSTSVIMITTFYRTFLKSCLTYSVLIVAFTTSFYILFKDEYSDFFGNYGLALFKTILMSTGEYDTSNLRLDKYPIVSYLILVLFVTLIAISLINLLTGLAVSDIHNIKVNAELHWQIIRIEQISRMEDIFLKRRLLEMFPFLKKICLFSVFSSDNSVGIDSEKNTVNIDGDGSMPINDAMLNDLKKIIQMKNTNIFK